MKYTLCLLLGQKSETESYQLLAIIQEYKNFNILPVGVWNGIAILRSNSATLSKWSI